MGIRIDDPFSKSAGGKLDFEIDWSAFLGTDSLTFSTWSVIPTGPTISNTSLTGSQTRARLAGGTAGLTYILRNHITTAGGQEEDGDLTIVIGDLVSYDLSTDVGKVRFYIGDTDLAAPKLTDAEIQFALTEGVDVPNAVIMAIQTLMARVTDPSFSADWLTVDPSVAYKSLWNLLLMRRQEFGIAALRGKVINLYRPDSDQTGPPDYSGGGVMSFVKKYTGRIKSLEILYMTGTGTISALTSSDNQYLGSSVSEQVMATHVPYRMIKTVLADSALIAGGQETLKEVYRLVLPFGTVIDTNYQFTPDDSGLKYQVIGIDRHRSQGTDVQADMMRIST